MALAKADRFAKLYSLTFDYGQRHRQELAAAERVAFEFGAEHRVIEIDLRQFGGSALTSDTAVPKDRDESAMGVGVPITYVPARNTIFLSYSLAWAEVLNVADVYIGVNAVDYSGYPDCRPEFIAAFQTMANLATRTGVEGLAFRVHAPLIAMTKAEIIRRGVALNVDYSITHSLLRPRWRWRSLRAMRQLPDPPKRICRSRGGRSDAVYRSVNHRISGNNQGYVI